MRGARSHVRFGSQADAGSATRRVRFAPIADIEPNLVRPVSTQVCDVASALCATDRAAISLIKICSSLRQERC
jgi:hypothetical protein